MRTRIIGSLCLVLSLCFQAQAQKKEHDQTIKLDYDITEVRKGKKMGFMRTSTKKLLTDIEYELYGNLWGFSRGCPVGSVSKKGKLALIDKDGKLLTPFDYTEIDLLNFAHDKIHATRAGKKGILNTVGKAVVPFEYEEISYMEKQKSQILVKKGGFWGVYDITAGKETIPCQYKNGEWHLEDLVVMHGAEKGEKIVFRVEKGQAKRISERDHDAVLCAGNNGFMMQSGNKWGFWQEGQKEEEIAYLYEGAEIAEMKGELAYSVLIKEKWGLLSATGKEIFKPMFSEAVTYFDEEGYAEAHQKNKAFFIHKSGKIIFQGDYERLQCDHSNHKTIRFKQAGKYGLMSFAGKVILPAQYDLIGEYDHAWYGLEEFTILRKDSLYGFADVEGEVFAKPMYQNCGCWYDNSEVGWILHNGSYFGLFAVQKGDKWGIIDRSGKVVLPIEYDRIECPHKDKSPVTKGTNTYTFNWDAQEIEK